MRLKEKRFVFTAFFFLLAIIGLYLGAFRYQLGSHVKAEWWIKNMYDVKDHIASSTDGPRIIILSGSNGLFGIDGSIIKEITEYKVVNLSVHASLHTSFLYYKIEEHMKKGDIVVMPLEFAYYQKDKIDYWFSSNMMAWGHDDYLSKLSLPEMFRFILSVPETRIFEGMFQKPRHSLFVSRKEAIEKFNSLLASKERQWEGYKFKSLDRYGSIVFGERPEGKSLNAHKKGVSYIQKNWPITDTFLSFYSKLSDLAEARGAKLILTWPVTIRNRSLDFTKLEHRKRFMDFKKRLAEKSVEVCFNPALFNLDVRFFFDTNYHTNKYGAAIRSENLAICIDKKLKHGICDDIDFDEAVRIVQRKESEFLAKIDQGKKTDKNFKRQKSKSNHEIVIADLKKIKKALAKYYKDNKKYPVSTRYDGLYSNHGKASKNWIPGLVPKYLDALPRDPRRTSHGSNQYLYKSDGKDYKLISHGAENGECVVKLYPELLDPHRKYWGYGYWTKGALYW